VVIVAGDPAHRQYSTFAASSGYYSWREPMLWRRMIAFDPLVLHPESSSPRGDCWVRICQCQYAWVAVGKRQC
jgi:hypothetical protein